MRLKTKKKLNNVVLAVLTKSVKAQAPHVEGQQFEKPGRVKPVTYQIYSCRYLAWHMASLR